MLLWRMQTWTETQQQTRLTRPYGSTVPSIDQSGDNKHCFFSLLSWGSFSFLSFRFTALDPDSVLDSGVTSQPVRTRTSQNPSIVLSFFFVFFRLRWRLQTEARKKKKNNKKKKHSSFILFSLRALSIFFPSLCWKWNEAEREDVGQTAVKWRPGPLRSVWSCVCVCVCICILFTSVCGVCVCAWKNKVTFSSPVSSCV